jgi:TetR/AcrR family transcriptional regulator
MAKNTEQIILEVARKHFVQNGFAGARMQEIADEAAINKAMLHYYFRSKEKLYHEIISQTLDTVIPNFAAALKTEGSFWEKAEKVVNTYIEMLIKNPDLPFFIMSELSQKRERFIEELKKRAQFFPAMQSFLRQIMVDIEEGKIRQVAPVHLLLNIMSMCVFPFIAKPVFCTVMELPEAEFEDLMKERVEAILDFLKHALKV